MVNVVVEEEEGMEGVIAIVVEVRYKSRQAINRQSIYRLSPYRKILIC